VQFGEGQRLVDPFVARCRPKGPAGPFRTGWIWTGT
jgi:hypothetical protein